MIIVIQVSDIFVSAHHKSLAILIIKAFCVGGKLLGILLCNNFVRKLNFTHFSFTQVDTTEHSASSKICYLRDL